MKEPRRPIRLQLAESPNPLADALPAEDDDAAPKAREARAESPRRRRRLGRLRFLAAAAVSLLWLGALGGYVWGYFGPSLFAGEPLAVWVAMLGGAVVPVVLVFILFELAWQAHQLTAATRNISRLAVQITEPEATAGQRVATVGTAVRRQLDILSGSLDAMLERIAAVETMVETQVSAVERAGGRAQMRAQMIHDLLEQERTALGGITDSLSASATAVVEAVGGRIAEVRSANERAAQEIAEAESALARQVESFRRMAEESIQGSAEKTKLVEGSVAKLEEVAAACLTATEAFTHRVDTQQVALSATADRLQAEGQRLDVLLADQRTLLGQVESATGALSARLKTDIEGITAEVDSALQSMKTSTEAAGKTMRAEAEAAHQAGTTAAQTITHAAAAARDAAEDMRAAVAAEMTALNQSLDGGMRSLDTVAATVNKTLTDAGQSAQTLTASLNATVGAVETASERLFAIIDGIGERASDAQGALDSASIEMEARLSRVPEMAAEHATRISALLGDQAFRLSALAEALGRDFMPGEGARGAVGPANARMTPQALPSPPPPPSADASPPAPAQTVKPQSVKTVDQNPSPPASDPADTAPIQHENASAPAEQSGGLRSLGRLGRRLRHNTGARRAAAVGAAASFDDTSQPEPQTGFWTALFSRIEGEDDTLAVPGGSFVVNAAASAAATESETEETRARHLLEGLHALAIDLDRLLEEDPPMDLWRRYRDGAQDVFAQRLVSLKSAMLELRIRQKFQEDAEFRDHATRFLDRFEDLIGHCDGESAKRAINTAPAGQLNALLVQALVAEE